MNYAWYYVVEKIAEPDSDLDTPWGADDGEFEVIHREPTKAKALIRKDEERAKELGRKMTLFPSDKFYNPGHAFRAAIYNR